MNNDNMSPEKAWFLGYLLSDGSIVRPMYRGKGDETCLSFVCKHDDREVLEKVKVILGTCANVHEYPNYKSPQAKLIVYDRKDIIERYSDIKSNIPRDIKGHERHFIRGCVDGDGTLSYRENRQSFRIGFIDERENITQWVSNTICENVFIPYKKVRWSPQNNLYEVMWEGNIARVISWWLYHGNIENCCLQRKLQKYRDIVLGNSFETVDEELLIASKAYFDDNHEIAFKVPGLQTLDWCHRLQKLLSYNTVPVFHNKGKRKYYHLYIPNQTINTQDPGNR